MNWDWHNDIQGKPESEESKSFRGAVQIASKFAKGMAETGLLSDTESALVKVAADVAETQAAVDVNTSWKERAMLGGVFLELNLCYVCTCLIMKLLAQ